MRIRDLKIFESVVKTGSLQGAADEIGMTQSAVTRVIHRLETDLGVLLFDRRSRPVQLTRQGNEAFEKTKDILQALHEMEHSFAKDRPPFGEFRLGVAHALASLVLGTPDLVGLNRFSEVRPRITTGWSNELLAGLRDRTLDACVLVTRKGILDLEDFTPTWLAQAPVRLIAQKALKSNITTLHQANEIGWVLNPGGCGYRRSLTTALERIDTELNLVIETNSMDLQLTLAAQGRVLTLAPGLPGVIDFSRYGVDMLEIEEFDHRVDFVLLSAPALGNLSPLADHLSAYLRQHFMPSP